ncbi:sensor histidine kinase [Aquimarina algiphila]|uniref:Sensor histidine kinase n=1 Tax=Aquimarina algiphila TaxID=2047982 RepID=A0A554VBR0_9FLAO|nr:sensor histidine kinase [Aquimarina algiphila]TSE04045.1 sensor histidine kinase [Aquimarina algiphila]
MSKFQKYKFEPGAMSIIQMGEELIGHPSTAINELVKNSYDADAGKCWVYTQYDKNPEKNFLIIKDDGLGMNNDTLFGDWLRPSKSSKRNSDKENRVSEVYNRKYLGSKGIGRLAAMALGQYLTVITKQSKEKEYNWIRVDREEFRVESLLNAIDFPGGKTSNYLELFSDREILRESKLAANGNLINILRDSPFQDFNEGTTIIIQNLDSSINTLVEEEFEKLTIDQTSIFKSLRDLITPLLLNNKIQDELLESEIIDEKLKIDNGEGTFELFYGINFIKNQIKGTVDFIDIEPSSILDHFDYRVYGKVFQDGRAKFRYLCKRFDDDPDDKIIDVSSKFNLSEEDPKIRIIEELEEKSKEKDSGVGEFYFDIRVYDLDSDAKEKMVKFLNAKGRKEANETFSKYVGLRVSKNGFGVKPYGEEQHDWMGLGAKRVQKHKVTIGPNQIIGNIFLYSPQNDGLKEKTNREGFYESKVFINFKKIIAGILEETGRVRERYRRKHGLGSKTINKLDRPDTEKFIQYILSQSDNKELISKTKQFVIETNDALDNMEGSLSFSQRLASLGTGLELVYHELAQPITVLGGVKTSLEINIKKIENDILKSKLLKRTENLEGAIDLLDELKKSLQPAIGKSIPKKFKPLSTFKKVCHLFEKIMEEHNIILEIKNNDLDYEIKNFEYIFWVSFLNILNNAVYWLKDVDKRVIIFEIESSEIIISNSGPKIPEDDLEVIFEYGITSKREKNTTGLGLSFTKNMLVSNNWEIYADNRSYGPAFHIKKIDK